MNYFNYVMNKAHWRKGVALMAMSKRLFRTKQAIESFEKCLQCTSLPENKVSEVQNELEKSKSRLQRQEDEVLMSVAQNCASIFRNFTLLFMLSYKYEIF